MKKLFLLMLIAFMYPLVFSKNKMQKELEKLRQTEISFSKMCVEKGMKASFSYYADKDVIKLVGEGKSPIIGIDSLIASYGEEREKFTLEWLPAKVEISKSADLGFTFGNWILSAHNGKKSYGVYYTVWKKQNDGNWKFIFDAGNSTPE